MSGGSDFRRALGIFRINRQRGSFSLIFRLARNCLSSLRLRGRIVTNFPPYPWLGFQ